MEYSRYWEDSFSTVEDIDIEGFLEGERESEIRRLEQERERIEALLTEREEIHEQNLDELESKLEWYVDRLELVYRRPGSSGETESLKSRIEDLYSEIRRKREQQWRDKTELEMELREIERALDEVEDDSVFDLL